MAEASSSQQGCSSEEEAVGSSLKSTSIAVRRDLARLVRKITSVGLSSRMRRGCLCAATKPTEKQSLYVLSVRSKASPRRLTDSNRWKRSSFETRQKNFGTLSAHGRRRGGRADCDAGIIPAAELHAGRVHHKPSSAIPGFSGCDCGAKKRSSGGRLRRSGRMRKAGGYFFFARFLGLPPRAIFALEMSPSLSTKYRYPGSFFTPIFATF